MLNKSTLRYPPDGSNVTPFNDGKRQYDNFLGEAYRERNIWRITAMIALCFLGISVFGWYWAASLPDTAYHVIEIAPWGEAKNIGVTGKTGYGDIQRPEQSIKYYLRAFIQSIRSVSFDKFVIRDNLSAAFSFVTNTGSNLLKTLLTENSLFDRAESERVEIVIESMLGSSQDAYQVDWYERIYSKQGELKNIEQYRGIFNLYYNEPNEKQIIINPLGIFIDEFSIQQINSK